MMMMMMMMMMMILTTMGAMTRNKASMVVGPGLASNFIPLYSRRFVFLLLLLFFFSPCLSLSLSLPPIPCPSHSHSHSHPWLLSFNFVACVHKQSVRNGR